MSLLHGPSLMHAAIGCFILCDRVIWSVPHAVLLCWDWTRIVPLRAQNQSTGSTVESIFYSRSAVGSVFLCRVASKCGIHSCITWALHELKHVMNWLPRPSGMRTILSLIHPCSTQPPRKRRIANRARRKARTNRTRKRNRVDRARNFTVVVPHYLRMRIARNQKCPRKPRCVEQRKQRNSQVRHTRVTDIARYTFSLSAIFSFSIYSIWIFSLCQRLNNHIESPLLTTPY